MSLLASKPEDSLALLRRLGIGVPESGAPSAAPGGYSKGDVINGEYRVLDAKEGGFGRVYLCEDLEPERRARGNRLVALKTPLRLRLAKGTDIDLFYAEAANWISLGSHSNIVYAWGFVEIARMPFVAMEYIENAVTLADEIDAGRTDWRVALRIGLGVARGLAHAQAEASLVHGDVKPLNILITPAGAAKVTDFGLSLIDPGGDDPVDGAICGTRGYIAPEMHRGNSGRSQPADMFAFGVTLFQTVTRRWPFPPGGPGPGPASAPPDAREFTPQVPAEVALLIAECLRSAPALRPPSFASLAERLESLHRRLLRTGPSTDASPDAPPRSEALVNAASSWHNLGQWDKARGVAKQAIAADRTNWKAHTELGCIFVSARDYSEALAPRGPHRGEALVRTRAPDV
ncbi:MAG: serine/threonine protein kinase [Deltaproteobacteria bacterium]|nr:MAG: serine/threonine protein kinase [Deltaproteobacteria bacterium]